jgi:peptide deformylase
MMSEIALRIWPDPILTKKAEPVTDFTPELNTTVIEMTKLMHAADGAGLAGPQAGLLKRIVVWKIEGREGYWINPEIVSPSETSQTLQEGCLSFPSILLGVTRADQVTVRYQDSDGVFHEEICSGVMAQMAQHEIDHLDGIVFTKNLSHLKKDIVDRKMKKFKKGVMRLKEKYEQQIRQQLRSQRVQPDTGSLVADTTPATPPSPVSTPSEGPNTGDYDFSIRSEQV